MRLAAVGLNLRGKALLRVVLKNLPREVVLADEMRVRRRLKIVGRPVVVVLVLFIEPDGTRHHPVEIPREPHFQSSQILSGEIPRPFENRERIEKTIGEKARVDESDTAPRTSG